jgi:DNA repair exonuclease SbcCD nuclease subunit
MPLKMIKKIIHIADLHIRTLQLHELYKTQFEKLIEEVKQHSITWSSEGVTRNEIRIVIAGDIAHQKINISNEQLMLTSWLLSQLCVYGKVVIIPGNHDFLENNVQRLDSISPVVDLLNNEDIRYYKDKGEYPDENINWIVYSLYQHNERPDFKKTEDKINVGLFHGPIQGMSTDLGFQFEDAYDRLNFVGLDLLLCGDIHKRQTFTLHSGGAGVMVGSLIQQNFGETVKHHGYGVYDVKTKKYDFIDLPNDQPYMHFKMSDIKDIEDEKEILVNAG